MSVQFWNLALRFVQVWDLELGIWDLGFSE
jgi:hypothetical protein